jgi:excinuclease ABC subunit A
VVIEHNLDVIKVSDYLIDLGPEGGEEGGLILATGTPEQIVDNPESETGRFLAELLSRTAITAVTGAKSARQTKRAREKLAA